MMIQRSQRVQCLTAVGITELNFESFLKVRIKWNFEILIRTPLIIFNLTDLEIIFLVLYSPE